MIWIDASAGASGDMLLGALLALDPDGLPVAQAAVDEAVARFGGEPVSLSVQTTTRAGLSATRAIVDVRDTTTHRTWSDIRPVVSGRAYDAFAQLAEAEARVHGIPVDEVHFHEVGALDAIADIVAVCALWERLGADHTVVSPVCVGSGAVSAAHGSLPVPAPAVAELLRGVPTFAGPVAHEACTPTGAALLRVLADEWGPQPPMTVDAIGTGAGGRDRHERPNVVRIFIGESSSLDPVLQLETTLDDLDPRLYPDVLDAVRAAGAVEAWWAPVVMKHGRPGVTITALVPQAALDNVAEALFRNSTTLGVRWFPVSRRTLARDWVEVDVDGRPVRVKRGWLGGELLTVQPEYRDVAAAANELGRPVREVLKDAGQKEVRTPPTGETATSEHIEPNTTA